MKNEITLDEHTSALPLELVERIADDNGWQVRSHSREEMSVDVSTRFGSIGMFFSWSEPLRLLQISSILDICVDADVNPAVYELLSLINEKLFLGHFSLISGTNLPLYRNSAILNGRKEVLQEQIHGLIDIAFEESYRYFTAFAGINNGYDARLALVMAIPECIGNA